MVTTLGADPLGPAATVRHHCPLVDRLGLAAAGRGRAGPAQAGHTQQGPCTCLWGKDGRHSSLRFSPAPDPHPTTDVLFTRLLREVVGRVPLGRTGAALARCASISPNAKPSFFFQSGHRRL